MKPAYIDSSLLLALRLPKPNVVRPAAGDFADFQFFSSNLLEAEVRACYRRERVPFQTAVLAGVEWVLPRRALHDEFAQVMSVGYLRGADLLHVATALYLRANAQDVWFATLDVRQGEIASALGFERLKTIDTI